MPCRIYQSQQWSTRLYHESLCHTASSFLTLTYSDDYLPDDYSVSSIALQKFMKRLRRSLSFSVRFFACGEYGGLRFRPHYHVLLFGHDFIEDRIPWRKSSSGFVLYRSPSLEAAWPFGHSEIGSVTPQSAGYVARYCTKKVGGDLASDHYTRVHPLTGQVVTVRPEFLRMSRKPGIGKGWLDRYRADVYPSAFVTVDGRRRPVPRYYLSHLSEAEQSRLRARAKSLARERGEDTDLRLLTIEKVAIARAEALPRTLEEIE